MTVARVIEHAEGYTCELGDGARALFTTRAAGNLSTARGERSEHGRAARDRLCEQLGLRWLCASRQVHGSDVLRIDTAERCGGEALPLDADGHATAAAG
ncbi:MAG TPA: laccase domain-containing protein, partial [Solirubrobacteraceae bacterium]|nr:laccase domain-containing protein [Solirubrobacteraceae bacterium]